MLIKTKWGKGKETKCQRWNKYPLTHPKSPQSFLPNNMTHGQLQDSSGKNKLVDSGVQLFLILTWEKFSCKSIQKSE